jgi:hypothetical protein
MARRLSLTPRAQRFCERTASRSSAAILSRVRPANGSVNAEGLTQARRIYLVYQYSVCSVAIAFLRNCDIDAFVRQVTNRQILTTSIQPNISEPSDEAGNIRRDRDEEGHYKGVCVRLGRRMAIYGKLYRGYTRLHILL